MDLARLKSFGGNNVQPVCIIPVVISVGISSHEPYTIVFCIMYQGVSYMYFFLNRLLCLTYPVLTDDLVKITEATEKGVCVH